MTPRDIPLMQPLRIDVRTEGLAARAVTVEIRSLNMDMGLNRTPLVATGNGHWRGETILPICSQRTMEWEAAVRGLGWPYHLGQLLCYRAQVELLEGRPDAARDALEEAATIASELGISSEASLMRMIEEIRGMIVGK